MSVARACLAEEVLRPRFLRDALLALAGEKNQLFDPVWSRDVLERLAAHLPTSIASRLIDDLHAGWPDSQVQPDAAVLSHLEELDAEDADVLATARAAGADTVVTNHPEGFPELICEQLSTLTRSPDAFLNEIFYADRGRVADILAMRVAAYRPPRSFSEFMDALHPEAPRFVEHLKALRSIFSLEAMTDEWRRALRSERD
ncbi:MAG TPA: hypothetical protein VE219_06200 [Candidatus Sulfotelmatobacter sp.]|nr:hypothetical protein [Candidatus Sulfotelmatobacter sp.]